MAKRLVRYKRENGQLIKIAETPVLENGKVDINWLPIVGTMGSAVIERGSNANGEYIKWADGTMICTGGRSFESPATLITDYFTVMLPAAFVNTGYRVQSSCYVSCSNGAVGMFESVVNSGAFTFRISALGGNQFGSYVISAMSFIAVGRWK